MINDLSLKQILDCRFEYEMNILQFICKEGSIECLRALTEKVPLAQKKELAGFRDQHLGSQAIHLAASSGNLKMIEILVKLYEADCKETTLSGQTVYHCAALKYNGIACIFLFRQKYALDTICAYDVKQASPLHFAVTCLMIKNV